MSKVLAGGMAAATSAVFGSYFGTVGTVGGAATGAVATTVSSAVYQRSIQRTRDTVKSKFGQRTQGRRTEVTLDTARPAAPPTPAPRRPSTGLLLGATLAIFAVGLALVTGVEWAKGSPLSGGERGTTLSRLIAATPAAPPAPQPAPGRETSPAPGRETGPSGPGMPGPTVVAPSQVERPPVPPLSPSVSPEPLLPGPGGSPLAP